MSEFEQQPDDLWRKVFDEVAETPPPRVWDAIERRLDESEGSRVLPLWGTGLGASRMLRWGAGLAAAIIVLLVGWWVRPAQTSPNADTSVAQTSRSRSLRPSTPVTPPAKHRSVAEQPVALSDRVTKPTDVTLAPDVDQRVLALNQGRSADQRQTQTSTQTETAISPSTASLVQAHRQLPNLAAISLTESASAPAAALVADRPNLQPVAAAPSAIRSVNSVTLAPAPQVAAADQASLPGNPSSAAQPVTQPAVAAREPVQNPLANDAFSIEPEVGQPKRKEREVWASVSLMPGAFDPAVALRTMAAPTFANSAVYNYAVGNAPAVNSQANFSVAYQASAGIQLTERWSIESGVGYLSARSTVESPTQVASAYVNQSASLNGLVAVDPGKAGNGAVSSLYVDLLRGQVSTAQAAGVPTSADGLFISNSYRMIGNYSNQVRQILTNDYQYVQVPVQLGYQLRPRKRLGLALLGGFLTNIFVRNTVADDLVVTSRDGVYRPLSWAASLGARFRYRPSRRWSASLAGLYQPSLGFGTRPESPVQSQPTSLGMSFGVDYHF